jgi:hypothetical protein
MTTEFRYANLNVSSANCNFCSLCLLVNVCYKNIPSPVSAFISEHFDS